MSATHSPGPWKRSKRTVEDACGHNVTEFDFDTGTLDMELMTAAPDLFATLDRALRALGAAREMLAVFEDHGGHDGLRGEGYRATIDQMDEAVSLGNLAWRKARGGA